MNERTELRGNALYKRGERNGLGRREKRPKKIGRREKGSKKIGTRENQHEKGGSENVL